MTPAATCSPEPSYWDLRLATHSISSDFGKAAGAVFEAVSQREGVSLRHIARSVDISKYKCAVILYTLIKHACIQKVSGVPRYKGQSFKYRVDINTVKARVCFSHLLRHIKRHYSELHYSVALSFALHGSMSFAQVCSFVKLSWQGQKGGSPSEKLVRQALGELVESAILIRTDFLEREHSSHLPVIENSKDLGERTSGNRLVQGSHVSWRLNPKLPHLSHRTSDFSEGRYVQVKETSKEICHQKHVEVLVRSRFGVQALRIFRLLQKFQLEQKQIAEMSMVPMKDTRDILYRLLKLRYVRMQEVARTHDHAPSRTNYLWRVDLNDVAQVCQHELTQTILNIQLRLQREQRRMSEAQFSIACHDSKRREAIGYWKRIRDLQLTRFRLGVLSATLNFLSATGVNN